MTEARWKILYTSTALKDRERALQNGFGDRIKALEKALRENPYSPPREKLVGNLSGAYSKRLNRRHRIVYQVLPSERVIKILSAWSHYE